MPPGRREHPGGAVPWPRRLPTRLVAAVLIPSAGLAAVLLGVLRFVGALTPTVWTVVVLGSIAAGSAVALLLGQRTVARVRALTDGLRDIARTGSTTALPVDDRDEVAEATRAFNRMLAERSRTEAELRARKEELERAAAARTETLRRHQLALQVGRLGIWEWEIESGSLVWSENMDATYRAAGRRLPDCHDAFLDSVHPEDRESLDAVLTESIRTGEPLEAEFRLAVEDGHERWLRTVGTVVQDAQGFAERVIGVAIDSTEERRTAEALQLRAAREHALAELGRLALGETTPEALVADATGVVGQVLPEARVRILQLRPGGDRVAVHGATDGWAGATEEIGPVARHAVEQGLTGRGEQAGTTVVAVPVAGRVLPWGAVELTAELVPSGDELFVRSVATLLGAAVGRLQAEEELRRAQRLEAVGRLAGGVAHDFNNLLTAQLGYAELIRERVDDTAAMHLDEIVGASERAATLVDHLLTFSRGANRAAVDVDVAELVRRLRGLLDRLIDEHIEVHVETAERAIAHADLGRLEEVVLNLAVNGRDAMPSGGTLSIAVDMIELGLREADRHRLEPGPHVRLRVADTGVGMDETTRERALEPFFTTKEASGTGLGLATVYGIVTAAGGALELSSSPGAGTEATVLLPACPADIESNGGPVGTALELAGSPGVPADGHVSAVRHVLLLESQPAVRDLLETALTRAGYHVTAVGAVAEAAAAIDDDPPDLLVADLVVGDDDARRLAARARIRAADLRVLYVSGTHQVTVSEDPRTAFLAKPFGPDEFVDAVARALGQATPV